LPAGWSRSRYVRSQINIGENQQISIDFTAGRGPNGLTATLDIVPAKLAQPVKAPVSTPVAEEAPKAAEPAEVAPEQPAAVDAAEDDTAKSEEDIADEVAEEAAPAVSPRSIFSKAS